MPDLGDYHGRPIIGQNVSIRKAGDGLSEALSIDPRDFKPGSSITVVLQCEVAGFQVRESKEQAEHWIETVILNAGTATIIEDASMAAALADQAERNLRAREAREGIQRLPLAEDLVAAHDAGNHHGLFMPGCPACQEAQDADWEGETPEAPEPTGRKSRRTKTA